MKTLNFIIIGTVSLALLAGCNKSEQVAEKNEVIRPAQLYIVADIATRYVKNFPALVEPSDESQLAFRVGGEIIDLPVVAGSKMKKGDVIARLDQTNFKLLLAKANANYDLALKTFQRQERMLSLELTSEAAFDSTNAQLTLAKVALDTAKNNLKYTVLRAPFDGVVSKLNFENHESIGARRKLLSFHSEDGVDVTFQLPESILSQKLKASARSYNPLVSFNASDKTKAKEFKATFQEVAHEADPKSRSFKVVITLPTPEGLNVVPGMTANVKLELDQLIDGLGEYALVPSEAVFSPETSDPTENKFAVWKVDTNTMMVHQQEVTVGSLTDQGIKVTSGLNSNDVIVAAGVNSLLEGTIIREWAKERGI